MLDVLDVVNGLKLSNYNVRHNQIDVKIKLYAVVLDIDSNKYHIVVADKGLLGIKLNVNNTDGVVFDGVLSNYKIINYFTKHEVNVINNIILAVCKEDNVDLYVDTR